MSAPVLTVQGRGQCPHGGPATLVPGATKVLAENGLVLLAGDVGLVAGCAFTVPTGKPQPCVKTQLTMSASKVLVENRPVLLLNPSDLALSAEQIPGGPVVWTSVQLKVIAT